ncbi:MAG: ribosome biogenesis GTPase Der [Alphaproteobacteria bacterium]|nr:ribosome biogenesis GTPase Der [Alphaproteobacteria bacterium]
MPPVLAIVGRPNVGKSTLFNRLLGQRQALVDDRPGVTRDRNYGVMKDREREIVLIDTGGFEPEPDDDLFENVRLQAEAAIDEADVILFVVDRQAGLTPADKLAADILRKRAGAKADRVLLVVNKCDGPGHDTEAAEFWSLGFDDMSTISAEHGRGVYELLESVHELLPEPVEGDTGAEDEDEIRVAVIGRPNIGKSTLVNLLTGDDRHVVHDAPGTTMDAVDSVVEVDGRVFRLVDTAGVRKKSKIEDRLETWASLRAIRTIERCHVSLLVIDGELGPSNQDARLAALVADRGRACIILVNRWDKVREDPERNVHVLRDEIQQTLPHLTWAPQLYISALTGKGCQRIFPLVEQVYAEFDKRIRTAPLNEFLRQVVDAYQPPQLHHHPVKLNYITQTRVRPPTFAIWVNTPEGIKAPYKRYLENRLREAFGFEGTPVRMHIKRKRRLGEAKEEAG